MRFIKFDKGYIVESFDGSRLLDSSGNVITIPFSAFFQVIIMDERWGRSIKMLSMWTDIRDKIKSLAIDSFGNEKILILTDEEWEICVTISEEPTNGYNIQLASACIAHARDLRQACSSLISLMEKESK